MIKHVTIKVSDDEPEFKEFGSLYSFAESRLNAEIERMTLELNHGHIDVCSITEDWSIREVRPVECNSGTWYKRRTLELSVWTRITY